MQKQIEFDSIATELMFTPIEITDLMSKYDVMYRKNKTVKDINKALNKSMLYKKSKNKTEYKLDEFKKSLIKIFTLKE